MCAYLGRFMYDVNVARPGLIFYCVVLNKRTTIQICSENITKTIFLIIYKPRVQHPFKRKYAFVCSEHGVRIERFIIKIKSMNTLTGQD